MTLSFPLSISPFLCGLMTLFPSSYLPFLVFLALWYSTFPSPLWPYDTFPLPTFLFFSFVALRHCPSFYLPFLSPLSFVGLWQSFPLPAFLFFFETHGSTSKVGDLEPVHYSEKVTGLVLHAREITVKLWNFLFIFKTGKRNCLHCVFEKLASNYNVVYMPFSLESRSDRDPNCSRLICSLWIV